MNAADTPPVNSPEEMAGRFYTELMIRLPEWKKRLSDQPSELPTLERDAHAVFAQGADLLIAGLLAIVMKQPAFDEACERTRRNHCYPLRRGRLRQLQIRLLGGLLIWVNSLYCEPRRSLFRKPRQKRPGLYIELAQFGFSKGCSPALESRVSRQAGLCPSLDFAREELNREGVRLDVKAIRRIVHGCGRGLLALRRHELMQWRESSLPAGVELKGKRVTVQIDGGRTKIRGDLRPTSATPEKTGEDGLPVENVPGRSKPRPTRTYVADWREPKLVTIFTHDDKGRIEKHSQATVDGTFLGPDAIAELISMHLHRLGAADAVSVTFAADGACWIWDRIPTIIELAKLDKVKVHEVLDCCHAVHHIALALAALGMNEQERMPLYREHRKRLRNGEWRRVVEELTGLADMKPENVRIRTEIAYLSKHGEAGRLKYPTFRRLGLPLGSGAIESTIRRVINLRLKGNGISWREERAETMLAVRAAILTDRWDERLHAMREHQRHDGRMNWQWEPREMSCKS